MPVDKVLGEIVYAGGRQIGNAIELEVLKEVSQSYLTQLWNNNAFRKEKDNKINEVANSISKYFTFAVIAIALISGLLWLRKDINSAVSVFTAVLIVACPCALALSIPFTLGNTLRIFGKLGFYLKNTSIIEKLTKITTVVFDKTGTITKTGDTSIQFIGRTLTEYDGILVKAVVLHSTHILSRKIYDSLDSKDIFDVENYKEYTGKGIYGVVDGNELMLGSLEFVEGGTEFEAAEIKSKKNQTDVYLSFNGNISGYFRITSSYREGLEELLGSLSDNYDIHLLSGDNNREKPNLLKVFATDKSMRFRQSPEDKLNYIKSLQKQGKRVLMIGDGLNDAGALSQSDVGITISDNIYNFSPACDAILDASMFGRISGLMDFSKFSIKVIIASFIFSFLYNIIGLAFAVNGLLSPIIAAILMPVSSVSVVLFAVISTNLYARRKGFIKKDKPAVKIIDK
jgi:Cu+-exporting ATPase